MEPKITWLGHASFRIETDEATVYIDPWKLTEKKKADLVLITHSHPDHFNEEDIGNISGPDTVVIGPPDVSSKMKSAQTIRPGGREIVRGIEVEGHRAYNINKEFHPRENDWLGYVLDIKGYRIYFAGDTDLIPEMEKLGSIDVALLPVGGTYTMDAKEAAKAASVIRPKKAIPMHWGDIVGDLGSAEEFSRHAKCDVEILKKS